MNGQFILLNASAHWLLPVAMNLVFVSLATAMAYLRSKHSPYFSKVESLAKIRKKIALQEKSKDEKNKHFRDEQIRINAELAQQSEDAATETTKTAQASLCNTRKSIASLEVQSQALLGKVDFTREVITARLRSAFADSANRKGNIGLKGLMSVMLLVLTIVSCSSTQPVVHKKASLIDVSGSMVLKAQAEDIADFILGETFKTTEVYEDGIELSISLIGNQSQSRKVCFNLPAVSSYWSVDEHQRKEEVIKFYNDVVASIKSVIADTVKKPATYINRSIAHILDGWDHNTHGELFIYSDMLEDNPYSVSFRDYMTGSDPSLLKHYDEISTQFKKDAPYTLANMDVYIIYLPTSDDELFRHCRQFWARFITDLGGQTTFVSNIDHSLTGE
ncbi:MAG: hypothetical protein JNK00_00295 [Flavipsychrobacter sp.]|nr:hypothetical protein [Flavipsychrobacter sp.]